MMKYQSIFYAMVLFFFISSCAAPASPKATNIPTITRILTQAIISPTSTKPSTPLPTAEPSATPIPTVVWANSPDKIVELTLFHGAWSPTVNEMVGVEELNDGIGRMILSSAPDFSNEVLDGKHSTVLENLIWYPDGQNILYAVSPLEGGCIGIECVGSVWSVARDGTNPHDLDINFGRGIEFWGWMDSHTIVYSSYAGGGHNVITEHDISADKVLVNDVVHVVKPEPVNPSYVLVTDCLLYCTTCILTRKRIADDRRSASYACRSDVYTRGFPRNEYPSQIDTVFQDWQPGTNNILILAQGRIEDAPVSRLLLWNADTDAVETIVPGGISGTFSPDGKILAFITYGSFSQYAATSLQTISFDPIDINKTPTLQLMDVSTRKIMVSVPINIDIIPFGHIKGISQWDKPVSDRLPFSPDSRYIVFPTTGTISLQDAKFPTEAIAADSTGFYLNILDLKTEQLVQSLSIDRLGKTWGLNLLWSPHSEKFVYQDGSENWQLFEISTHTIIPITLHNGSQLPLPAWSYDGTYLSFSSYYGYAGGPPKSFIIASSNLP